VFGLMKDATIDELRGYIDQLLAAGLLQQGGDEYPILQITADGLALLKDAGAAPDLTLARQKRPDRRLPKRARVETEGWEGVDRELFEELRVLRMEIARRRRVPPYVIFHDTTLREIARSKPKTKEESRHVYGVGDRKAETSAISCSPSSGQALSVRRTRPTFSDTLVEGYVVFRYSHDADSIHAVCVLTAIADGFSTDSTSSTRRGLPSGTVYPALGGSSATARQIGVGERAGRARRRPAGAPLLQADRARREGACRSGGVLSVAAARGKPRRRAADHAALVRSRASCGGADGAVRHSPRLAARVARRVCLRARARPGSDAHAAASLARALGAIVHAAWLRWDRWRLDMICRTSSTRRALRASRVSPSVDVLTLAIGIGGTTAIFGAVNAVLLRPLPYPTRSLVRVYKTTVEERDRIGGTVSPPDFATGAATTRVSRMAASTTIRRPDGWRRRDRFRGDVTGGFFDVMGWPLGRRSPPATIRWARDVVVLSIPSGSALWIDPASSATAVDDGVLARGDRRDAAGFQYPLRGRAVGTASLLREGARNAARRPLHRRDRPAEARGAARARPPGRARDRARAGARFPRTNRDNSASVHPLRESLVGSVRQSMFVLLGAVGLVLRDRVREHGQPGADARHRPRPRAGRAHGDRRGPAPRCPIAAGREPRAWPSPARRSGWCSRTGRPPRLPRWIRRSACRC
jgi:hypothetical protein